PARPYSATASISSGGTSLSPSRATALRAFHPRKSLRPPPTARARKRATSTALRGSPTTRVHPWLGSAPAPRLDGRRGGLATVSASPKSARRGSPIESPCPAFRFGRALPRPGPHPRDRPQGGRGLLAFDAICPLPHWWVPWWGTVTVAVFRATPPSRRDLLSQEFYPPASTSRPRPARPGFGGSRRLGARFAREFF